MGFTKFMKKVGVGLLRLAPALIAAASIITAATPNPVDDGVVMAIHKFLDVVSLSDVGYNKQAGDE